MRRVACLSPSLASAAQAQARRLCRPATDRRDGVRRRHLHRRAQSASAAGLLARLVRDQASVCATAGLRRGR
jgi:hypothetical protein